MGNPTSSFFFYLKVFFVCFIQLFVGFGFLDFCFLITEMKNEIVNMCVYTVHNDDDAVDDDGGTSQ